MDLSQYAELFLAESREHLSACNQLLLAWERKPASLEPVGGLFRAVHTVKGMAATMGYAAVTDLAHRTENLLDHLRRGAHPATDELLQLLFRARDALEQAVELSVRGRERDLDLSAITAELDRAAARAGRKAGRAAAAREPPPPPIEALAAPGRLVQVVLRAEAPLKGARCCSSSARRPSAPCTPSVRRPRRSRLRTSTGGWPSGSSPPRRPTRSASGCERRGMSRASRSLKRKSGARRRRPQRAPRSSPRAAVTCASTSAGWMG